MNGAGLGDFGGMYRADAQDSNIEGYGLLGLMGTCILMANGRHAGFGDRELIYGGKQSMKCQSHCHLSDTFVVGDYVGGNRAILHEGSLSNF